MILNFLRLFPDFRWLELQHQAEEKRHAAMTEFKEATTRRLSEVTADRELWKAKAAEWEARYVDQVAKTCDAIKAEVRSVEKVADGAFCRVTGRVIYNPVPVVPSSANPQELPAKPRMQARQAVQAAERQFAEDMRAASEKVALGYSKPIEGNRQLQAEVDEYVSGKTN